MGIPRAAFIDRSRLRTLLRLVLVFGAGVSWCAPFAKSTVSQFQCVQKGPECLLGPSLRLLRRGNALPSRQLSGPMQTPSCAPLSSRPKSVFPQHLGRCATPRLARLGPEPSRSTLRRRGRLLDQDSRSPTAASASSFAACRPLDAALNAPYSGSPHPGRLRHEHSSTYCMHIKLNALTGRLKPLSASSPTGSMVAKLSTAARTRLSIRICPSLASPHNRAARFTTMPTAA